MKAVLITKNQSAEEIQVVKGEASEPAASYSECGYQGIGKELKDGDAVIIRQYLKIGDQEVTVALQSESEQAVECFSDDTIDKIEKIDPIQIKKDNANAYYYILKYNKAVPGLFTVSINGAEKTTVSVTIVPAMSEKDYDEIVHDLYQICADLIISSGTGIGKQRRLGETSSLQRNVNQWDMRLRGIRAILLKLSEKPETDVIGVPERVPFHKIKSFDDRLLLEHHIKGQHKVTTRVHQQTCDIYENRILLGYVMKLKEHIEWLTRNAEQAESEMKVLSQEEKGRSTEELKRQLFRMRESVQTLLELDIFSGVKDGKGFPHRTNLFLNHPLYAKAYSYINETAMLDKTFRQFPPYKNLAKASRIYELWCFFQILQIMTRDFKFRVQNCWYENERKDTEWKTLVNEIVEHNQNQEDTLYSLLLKLTPENESEGKPIYLAYNYLVTIAGQEETNRRPDILLIVDDTIYTCDAKYNNYKEQGIGQWYSNMIGCAAYKYIYKMKANQLYENCKCQDEDGNKIFQNPLRVGAACILSPYDYPEELLPIVNCRQPDSKLILSKTFLQNMMDSKNRSSICNHKESFTYDLKTEVIPDNEREELIRLLKSEEKSNTNITMNRRLAYLRFDPSHRSGFSQIFDGIIKGKYPFFVDIG